MFKKRKERKRIEEEKRRQELVERYHIMYGTPRHGYTHGDSSQTYDWKGVR